MGKDSVVSDAANEVLRNRLVDSEKWTYQPVPVCSGRASTAGPLLYSEENMRTEWICGVGYEIRHILDIDCVAQRWSGTFIVYIKWYSKQHLSPIASATGVVDRSKVAPPQAVIWNSLDTKVQDETVTRLEDDPPGVLLLETLYTATMSEFMELEMFPLDVQDLTLILRFKDPRWSIRTLPDQELQVIATSVEVAEWFLYEPQTEHTRDKISGRAIFQLKLRVFRKSGYYMTNVVAMVGGIATLTFLAFLFGPHQWEQRSTFSATLLLTSVAFKFILANALPKVPFMTLLDIYLIVSFLVMIAAIVESGAMYLLYRLEIWDIEELHSVDLTCAIGLASTWLLWNVGYYCRFYTLESKQRQRSDLGTLLSHISTNSTSKGAMNHLRSGEIIENEDGEDLSDADGFSENPSSRARCAAGTGSPGETGRTTSNDA